MAAAAAAVAYRGGPRVLFGSVEATMQLEADALLYKFASACSKDSWELAADRVLLRIGNAREGSSGPPEWRLRVDGAPVSND